MAIVTSPVSNGVNNVIPKKKHSSSLIIYLSHVLTSWGDRMWGFAVGLYLTILFPGNLLHNAIYGLSVCSCVILGGPIIGKWIDRKSRLAAATTAIIIQNTAVIVCALMLIMMLVWDNDMRSTWNGHLRTVMFGLVVLFAVIAELASLASKIAIEKDWIVVLAENDEGKLSRMNSIMRTIDLTTSILAPIGVSQIIYFITNYSGAVFIASWNIISGGIEIYLLHKIFRSFPDLAKKLASQSRSDISIEITQMEPNANTRSSIVSGSGINFVLTPRGESKGMDPSDFTEISLVTPKQAMFKGDSKQSTPNSGHSYKSPFFVHSSKEELVGGGGPITMKTTGCLTIRRRFHETLKGWKDYFTHQLRFAGIGLAVLYMTVLGFDAITIGYMKQERLNESQIGIVMGIGSLSGILGSLSFPFMRKHMGKSVVGIFGFSFQTTCLVLCVVSVFLPGSPFKPEDLWESNIFTQQNTTATSTSEPPSEQSSKSYVSIICFVTGLIISRYGLWIADLSVTQLFQEEVQEQKRGVLNGVQGSLNQCFNLLKFVLVIFLPEPSTFGYLAILSWIFVFSGWTFFMIFSCVRYRKRIRVNTKLKATEGHAAGSGLAQNK